MKRCETKLPIATCLLPLYTTPGANLKYKYFFIAYKPSQEDARTLAHSLVRSCGFEC